MAKRGNTNYTPYMLGGAIALGFVWYENRKASKAAIDAMIDAAGNSKISRYNSMFNGIDIEQIEKDFSSAKAVDVQKLTDIFNGKVSDPYDATLDTIFVKVTGKSHVDY